MQFDYIICHGVYSWVPGRVQERILEICKTRLAANGIAYVSYNTYPGWHLRGMIRDMMKYHTQHFHEPNVRVKQARNLLDFLARALDPSPRAPLPQGARVKMDPYSLNLRAELELVRRCSDSYLFHEHLEDENEPCYFHQFAERAAAKGLRYLGEADFAVMVPGNYPPEISNVLHMVAVDLIHMEQYMDFLRNRTFRQSLLCHPHQTPNYKLNPDAVRRLHVASHLKPEKTEPDVQSEEPEQFKAADGAMLGSKKPIMKAALLHLSRIWPRSISFGVLCEQARALIGAAAEKTSFEADAQTLANGILTTYASVASHMLELHAMPCPYSTEVGEKPRASPLARLQAESGNKVTNLRHEQVELEAEFDRRLLRLLDGTRGRNQIMEALAVASGELVITQEEKRVTERDKVRELFEKAIDRQLQQLAELALFLG